MDRAVRLIAVLVAGVGLQVACGAPNEAPATSPPASVCRALKAQSQQHVLDTSAAPTPGFSLQSGSHPVGIIPDRDGSSVWLLATGVDRVMHVLPAGAATSFQLPTSELGIQLSQAPDGTVWVPEQYRGAVASISPDGSVQECKLPGTPREATATSAAADGSVWVAAGSTVDRLSAGRFTEYPVGTSSALSVEVLADASGGAWFTLNGAPDLGRVTPQGEVQLFPIGGSGSAIGLLAAPDGAIWVADFGGDRVVRVAADHSVSEWKTPPDAKPQSLAAGPGGVLWITESGANVIGRVHGSALEDAIRTGGWPDHLAISVDGWAWFTEYNDDRLGRVRLP